MKRLFCLAFILNFSVLSYVATAEAAGNAPRKQRLVYEVYAGGIHAVQAHLDIDYTKKGRYSIELAAHTRGFLGALAPWEGVFESHGWVMKGDLRPELHRSTTTWRGEAEVKSYNYSKKGGFQNLMIKEHDKPEFKKEVADEVTKGTTDAFTAALLVMEKVFNGEKCEGSSEVFDGKRRFEQIFRHAENSTLKASRYNIYDGPAAKCTVEIKPVNGEWSSKPRGWLSIQEQGRERGTMPTVWIGNLTEEGPAVPVKIFVKTAYGAMVMHLAEYQNGESIMVAENREKD